MKKKTINITAVVAIMSLSAFKVVDDIIEKLGLQHSSAQQSIKKLTPLF